MEHMHVSINGRIYVPVNVLQYYHVTILYSVLEINVMSTSCIHSCRLCTICHFPNFPKAGIF